MSDPVTEHHIECVRCTASIDLSVLRLEIRETYVTHSVDELLVDYGWLPTTQGSYCPDHARSVRGR